jgi:hypothetical protein
MLLPMHVKEKIKHILVFCVSISLPSVCLAELCVRMWVFLPPRITAFVVCFLVMWLFLDNIVLGLDLMQAKSLCETKNQADEKDTKVQQDITSYDYQELQISTLHNHLDVAMRKKEVLQKGLDQECKQHRETATVLDRYVELNRILNIFLQKEKQNTKTVKQQKTAEGAQNTTEKDGIYWQIMASKARTKYYTKKAVFYTEYRRVCVKLGVSRHRQNPLKAGGPLAHSSSTSSLKPILSKSFNEYSFS